MSTDFSIITDYSSSLQVSISGSTLANRPVFISNTNIVGYVEEKKIDFPWFPGLSKSQKQKSIESLHNAFIQEYPGVKVLEISSKSYSL